MLVKVISRVPLRYAGKHHAPGDTIEMPPKDARVLMAIRKVVIADAVPEPEPEAQPKGKPGPKPKGKPGPKPKVKAEAEPEAAPEPVASEPAAEPEPVASEPNADGADAMSELLGIEEPTAPRRVGYKRRDMVAEGE